MEIITEPDGSFSIRQADTGLVAIRHLEFSEAKTIVAMANRARARRRLMLAMERQVAALVTQGETAKHD